MKVVVFGGSGFLGSHVADALTERGHQVTLFDLKPSVHLDPRQKMVVGDILDTRAVARALKGMDYVYHFAGLADLDEGNIKSMDTVKQNIMGTVGILEAAVQARVKRFVYASTIYVYSQLGGFYRCSKQAGELYIEEFQRRHQMNYTILRYGTLYGPRSDEKNSIWRYLQQALIEKKMQFHGTGEEMREYIHVRDAARLSVDILADEYANQAVIITGHHAMKTKDMLMMIKEILNHKVSIEFGSKINSIHYAITPYSFIPKIGKKLVSTCYEDMGQSLLECVHDMSQRIDLLPVSKVKKEKRRK